MALIDEIQALLAGGSFAQGGGYDQGLNLLGQAYAAGAPQLSGTSITTDLQEALNFLQAQQPTTALPSFAAQPEVAQPAVDPFATAGLGLSTSIDDLDAMDDNALLALAQQEGVDTTGFSEEPLGLTTEGITEPLGLNVSAPEVTISPEAQAQVESVFAPQQSRLEEDLKRAAVEAAGARGLNLADTPIGAPYLRNLALGLSELGGRRAGALLGLNTNMRDFLQRQAEAREQALQQRAGFLQGQRTAREGALQGRAGLNLRATEGRQNFLSGLYNYQQQLQQQAFENRLRLSQQLGQGVSSLYGFRAGQPTGGTTTNIGAVPSTNYGQLLGALEGGLSGLSGIFGGGSTISGEY